MTEGTTDVLIVGGGVAALETLMALHGNAVLPGNIADAVCFLASDAATHITGVELPVDGGILASTYGTAYGTAVSS
jgi:NAD(P)-dependent dehydrogenase (short-subunit alcohol dehydrogenase family)